MTFKLIIIFFISLASLLSHARDIKLKPEIDTEKNVKKSIINTKSKHIDAGFLVSMQSDLISKFNKMVENLDHAISCLDGAFDESGSCSSLNRFFLDTSYNYYSEMKISLMIAQKSKEIKHYLEGAQDVELDEFELAAANEIIVNTIKVTQQKNRTHSTQSNRFVGRRVRSALISLRAKHLKNYQYIINQYSFLAFIPKRQAHSITESVIAESLRVVRENVISAKENFGNLSRDDLIFTLGSSSAIMFYRRSVLINSDYQREQLELLNKEHESEASSRPLLNVLPWIITGIVGCTVLSPIGCGIVLIGSGGISTYKDVTYFQSLLEHSKDNFFIKLNEVDDLDQARDQRNMAITLAPLTFFEILAGYKILRLAK
jgi:hypothetical protein